MATAMLAPLGMSSEEETQTQLHHLPMELRIQANQPFYRHHDGQDEPKNCKTKHHRAY